MFKLFSAFRKDKVWDFNGGIHPPEMKTQSNGTPLRQVSLPQRFVIPLKQHIGAEGELCVKVGDRVLRGQPPRLSVKVWIGVAEYSTLPARHADIRSAIARALCACTGLETVRIDLIFYTAHTETAHNTADPLPEGGQA